MKEKINLRKFKNNPIAGYNISKIDKFIANPDYNMFLNVIKFSIRKSNISISERLSLIRLFKLLKYYDNIIIDLRDVKNFNLFLVFNDLINTFVYSLNEDQFKEYVIDINPETIFKHNNIVSIAMLSNKRIYNYITKGLLLGHLVNIKMSTAYPTLLFRHWESHNGMIFSLSTSNPFHLNFNNTSNNECLYITKKKYPSLLEVLKRNNFPFLEEISYIFTCLILNTFYNYERLYNPLEQKVIMEYLNEINNVSHLIISKQGINVFKFLNKLRYNNKFITIIIKNLVKKNIILEDTYLTYKNIQPQLTKRKNRISDYLLFLYKKKNKLKNKLTIEILYKTKEYDLHMLIYILKNNYQNLNFKKRKNIKQITSIIIDNYLKYDNLSVYSLINKISKLINIDMFKECFKHTINSPNIYNSLKEIQIQGFMNENHIRQFKHHSKLEAKRKIK